MIEPLKLMNSARTKIPLGIGGLCHYDVSA